MNLFTWLKICFVQFNVPTEATLATQSSAKIEVKLDGYFVCEVVNTQNITTLEIVNKYYDYVVIGDLNDLGGRLTTGQHTSLLLL